MPTKTKHTSVTQFLQEDSASLPAFVVPRLLRIQDAAKYLSGTTWQIETLLRENVIPSFVLGERRVVDRLEFDRYVERRTAEAKDALKDKDGRLTIRPKRGIDVVAEFFRVRDPEINHRGLKILVPQPHLDSANRNSGFVPAGRARFAKPVQVNVLADRLILARDLDNLLFVEPAYREFCLALPAVQTCAKCDPLQLPQEMIVRPSFFVHKNPTVLRCPLSTDFQKRDE
jgi:hypothetical protein